MEEAPDFTIKTLGKCTITSPLSDVYGEYASFVRNDSKSLYDTLLEDVADRTGPASFPAMEVSGPREKIFFDPAKSRAAIVTCGGLCPGINNVIRGITLCLHHQYGAKKVYGFQYGYEGFIPKYKHDVINLTPEYVDAIHEKGGSVLSSSRGEQSSEEIVDCLDRMDINMLFCIGGDGTMRGAQAIAEEVKKRELNIAVMGIPKTIDNDISFTDNSFGFQTAYATAIDSIRSAHVEANGAPNGVGLVKLMGRHSGFIACFATMAQPDVNFCIIPETPFDLEGPGGFYASLRKRLERRGHAVVVVAEGAGQDLFTHSGQTRASRKVDASGNVKLMDIGPFLRDGIAEHFRQDGFPVNVKYIDPSYMIRSVPANPIDSVFCGQLARHAVHAAMTGRTEMLIGNWKQTFVHVPIATAISKRKKVNPHRGLWRSVLETTGQPSLLNPKQGK
ncbi:MAG: ATP-dependent 6-phosphofructokinase [Planctomycetota bacterium]|jgi:6-phosphofructokinase 1|nr:ATP-dependent 6-phosphofructokinase [Planctomycetota bacterium]